MKIKHAKQPEANYVLGDLNVNMSNVLIRAAHGLSLSEKRVVCACLAKLDSVRLADGRYKFRLSSDEYAKTFDVSTTTAYEQLRDSGKHLMKRTARFVEDTPRGKKEQIWVWVSGVTYHEGEGWVELGFSPEMTPHLALLRREFTSYKLKHTSALRSVYSWRLFELMVQFKDTGLLRLSVEDFCHAMEVSPTARGNFGELTRRVIEPAVKELIDKNGLLIQWKGTKPGGRRIQGLEFMFKDNPQHDMFGEVPPAEPIFPAPKPKQKLLGKAKAIKSTPVPKSPASRRPTKPVLARELGKIRSIVGPNKGR